MPFESTTPLVVGCLLAAMVAWQRCRRDAEAVPIRPGGGPQKPPPR